MDHVEKTIDLALGKLREQEAAVAETKRLINSLRKWTGQEPMFLDSEAPPEATRTSFRSDEFYGQPLSTVIRKILEARRAAGQDPPSVNEIYAAMMAGGYKFETANDDNAKRMLRISLTKNSATFHKLPNGSYGLREWYPSVKDSKPKAPANGTAAPADNAGGSEEDAGFDFEGKEQGAEVQAASA